ncbi:MAG TPA: ABC transporter substrate-binding protein [Symbiobacteriaceae bacterium]|nr:ABC transporter substrate-binding protein [Symbiobacteriaceae bacterium]
MTLRRGIAMFLALVMLTLIGCSSKTNAPAASPTADPAKPVEISFYYPVAVGGPLTQVIDTMVADFTKANPNIKVTPVFSGSYADTLTKVQTLIQGGQKPDVSVLLSTDVYTLVDQDAIIPLDDLVKADPEGQKWLDDFYPAFLSNSRIGKTLYGVPFQRSTIVMYWNKDLFKAAGLDRAPKSWDEMVEYGKKLNKPADGIWALKIPSDGYPYWLTQALSIEAGKNIMNEDGTEVYFTTPENTKAIEFFRALAFDHKIMPEGVTAWAAAPTDFISGKVAMLYHTTGSLTNIAKNAKFNFGVAMLPAGPKGFGSPTGGGNFYVFKGIAKEKQAATWKFIKFMTQPERLAQWSIDTGYVAPRKSAYETPVMKEFVAKNPDYLIARDQLQYAQAELSTHNNQQIYKIYSDRLQAIITGKQGVKEALEQAQKEADTVLAKFRKK